MIQDITSVVDLESTKLHIHLQETAGCIWDINTVFTAHEFHTAIQILDECTYAWKWYEKEQWQLYLTLHVFIMLEKHAYGSKFKCPALRGGGSGNCKYKLLYSNHFEDDSNNIHNEPLRHQLLQSCSQRSHNECKQQQLKQKASTKLRWGTLIM